jgi:uncharacterized protein with gpF-like domain
MDKRGDFRRGRGRSQAYFESDAIRARAAEVRILYGQWVHRSSAKVPREEHEAMHGKKFKLSDGLYDSHEGRLIHPGELVNCHCTSRYLLDSEMDYDTIIEAQGANDGKISFSRMRVKRS